MIIEEVEKAEEKVRTLEAQFKDLVMNGTHRQQKQLKTLATNLSNARVELQNAKKLTPAQAQKQQIKNQAELQTKVTKWKNMLDEANFLESLES